MRTVQKQVYETISQEEFDRNAKIALERQPVRKRIALADLTVVSDGIIDLKGIGTVKIAERALTDICRISKMPKGFAETIQKTFGETAKSKLINRLKMAAAANGKSEATLILNPTTKQIISIKDGGHDIISGEAFLDTTVNLIDKHNLNVESFAVDPDGGISINTSSPNNEWMIPDYKDEKFFAGVNFRNQASKGFSVIPYLHRLWCSNGMIDFSFDEIIRLDSLSGDKPERFYEKLDELAMRKFQPLNFVTKVKRASNVKASLAEMEFVHSALLSAGADPMEANSWVPLIETRDAYSKAGMYPGNFNREQMKRATTDINLWELVNEMTHFATHDNGIPVPAAKRHELQMEAGKLLARNSFDLENNVRSPFVGV